MSDTSAAALNGLAGSFLGLTVIMVALRFYARKHLKVAHGPDDWLMLFAVINFLGSAICVFLSTTNKDLGYSSGDLPTLGNLKESNQLGVALNSFLAAGLGSSKASALFFYKRIFCVSGRKAVFNIIVLTMVVVVACWTVIMEFLSGFQCGTHFSALWDGTYAQYCVISKGYILSFGISGFILDLIILTLPIPLILRLKAPLSRKLSIMGIFLLASVGLAAAIVRMVIYIRFELGGGSYAATHNIELQLSKAYFYSVLEAGISIVAINVPSVWLLCVHSAPEALLRSVRSVMSLASRDSNTSKDSRPAEDETTKTYGGSSNSAPTVHGTQFSSNQDEETYTDDTKETKEANDYENV